MAAKKKLNKEKKWNLVGKKKKHRNQPPLLH
jgi:hypothetical protein